MTTEEQAAYDAGYQRAEEGRDPHLTDVQDVTAYMEGYLASCHEAWGYGKQDSQSREEE